MTTGVQATTMAEMVCGGMGCSRWVARDSWVVTPNATI